MKNWWQDVQLKVCSQGLPSGTWGEEEKGQKPKWPLGSQRSPGAGPPVWSGAQICKSFSHCEPWMHH